jgi:glyoxalase family protein
MTMNTLGIHHITSLASDPQRNLDFYTGFLGLRLVKQTVNFDAPDVYHLYYGDETGTPGTILTFFPFPDAVRGKRGAGEISAIAFTVPVGSFDSWIERLSRKGLPFQGPETRFAEKLISFEDPDGMVVELVEDTGTGGKAAWSGSPVDQASAIGRFHGVTIRHRSAGPTTSFLLEGMGFTGAGSEGQRARFLGGNPGSQGVVDVIDDPSAPMARQSAGSVHHIAWRVKDDAEQLEWQKGLPRRGANPTAVMDRCYFHSIYFREPGGVLFEMATDPPGFSIDEPVDSLGSRLRLPSWLEGQRQLIERHLPPLVLPAVEGARSPRESA